MKKNIFYNFIFTNSKGSFTLEATIIFPIVLIIIIGLLCIPFILYQKVSIQALADYSARRGVRTWGNINKDINTGRSNFNTDKSCYLKKIEFHEYDNSEAGKEEKLGNWIVAKLKTNAFLYDKNTNVNVNMKNYFIFKKLNLEIKKYYKIPFSICDTKYSLVKGNSLIAFNNPVSLTRNVDFLVEVEKELEGKYKSFEDLMEKIRNVIKDITQSIEKFGDVVIYDNN